MNRRDAETRRKQGRFSQTISFRSVSLCVSASLRLIVFSIGLAAIGCTIPNLEKPQCTAGRDVVKRFYSFHVGNDMTPSPQNLKAREKFLTSPLLQKLSGSNEQKKDYFTATEDYPKAFRVGECTADAEGKATLQVVLLWRNDTRSEQKEVLVEAVNSGGNWLINKVFN